MKSKYLRPVALALLLSPLPGRAGALSFVEPDASTGSSLAAVVAAAPLAHTAQVLPLDAAGRIVGAGDVHQQAEQVLANLERTLRRAQSGLQQIAKLNVYLARDEDLPIVQAALAKTFSGATKPAMCFVSGALPEREMRVAMDAVAVSSVAAKAVKGFPVADGSGLARVAVLPAGPKLYVSGMADTNNLIPATRKTLEKLVAAIGQLGSQREDIVQLKVFLQPMSEIDAVRKEVGDFFGSQSPPTVFVEWISTSPVVEIELIAAAKGDLAKETVSFLTPPGTTSAKVYSRVARVNHGKLIYTGGLYGVKSSDGAGQVREIFATLDDITKQTGSDFEHLVKATYYVTDSDASDKLNALRPEYYNPQRPPAASKAKVKSVGFPGKSVTMDMIAVTK